MANEKPQLLIKSVEIPELVYEVYKARDVLAARVYFYFDDINLSKEQAESIIKSKAQAAEESSLIKTRFEVCYNPQEISETTTHDIIIEKPASISIKIRFSKNHVQISYCPEANKAYDFIEKILGALHKEGYLKEQYSKALSDARIMGSNKSAEYDTLERDINSGFLLIGDEKKKKTVAHKPSRKLPINETETKLDDTQKIKPHSSPSPVLSGIYSTLNSLTNWLIPTKENQHDRPRWSTLLSTPEQSNHQQVHYLPFQR